MKVEISELFLSSLRGVIDGADSSTKSLESNVQINDDSAVGEILRITVETRYSQIAVLEDWLKRNRDGEAKCI